MHRVSSHGGSSSSGFLIRKQSKQKTPPGGVVSFEQITAMYIKSLSTMYMKVDVLTRALLRLCACALMHLQCVTVCCSVLQCVAVCCSVL